MSFEDHMKRKNEARMIFLREDAKLRIQRAAHANIRRAQEFETGQLVYFFRRGRGHGNRYESYWFGPAKVVCVEKRATPKGIKVLVLLFGLFTVPLSTAVHQSNFVWSHMKFKI